MMGGKRFFIDWGLMTPVFFLLCFSLAVLSSVQFGLFLNQLIFSVVGFGLYLFCSQIHFKTLRNYIVPIYVFSVFCLLFVIFLGLETRGAVRWIEIAGFRLQFSEILKPILMFCLAAFLAKRDASFKTFAITLLFSFPVFFLIAKQPDLGSAIVYAATIGLSLLVVGFSFKWFFAGIILLLVLGPMLWNFLHEYQKKRIIAFVNPTVDPLGISYNVIQSVIAVGSGMFFGKGLDQGTQSELRFLPERHTDFIFATLSEGLGFFGSALILILFFFLLMRIIVMIQNSRDTFFRYFAVLSFFLIFVQFALNIGMNIGVVPVVGITLPFVSYGGSSLLSLFFLLGILTSLYKDSEEESIVAIG